MVTCTYYNPKSYVSKGCWIYNSKINKKTSDVATADEIFYFYFIYLFFLVLITCDYRHGKIIIFEKILQQNFQYFFSKSYQNVFK